MRGARLFAVSVLALLLLLAGSVGTARAAAIFVSPGESIQAAVNAANPYDTIYVLPGTYRENVVIQKDGIKLRGNLATLEPGGESLCGPVGICVLGDVAFGEEGPIVNAFVRDVVVSGFEIRGFEDSGILALGAEDARFRLNRTFDNEEYGIAAFASTGTRVLGNLTAGSHEAGIYLGDSPNADLLVASNVTMGNRFGIFLRNAMHGSVFNNVSQQNCIGVFVLADAPGPAGFFRFTGNTIRGNSRACPPGEEGPAFSGIGVLLFGAVGNVLIGNRITDNVPSGPTPFSGGVVVISGLQGTPPNGNIVTRNVIRGNDPDILWDGAGNNTLSPNDCGTSVPPGLC